MSLQVTPGRTMEDIERLERVPLATRLAVSSTYELLHKAVASSPEQPIHCFLPPGDERQPSEALTARAFLGKVHQTANLLADLGMGSQDVMALLLPDLLETRVLLWGGWPGGRDYLSDPPLLTQSAGRQSTASSAGRIAGCTGTRGESRAVAEDEAGSKAGEEYHHRPASRGTG